MGSAAHVVVAAGLQRDLDRLVERARLRVLDLEHRWSRFRSDSDISRLNANPGHPVPVSRETCLLVHRAVEGWALTNGCFDPTILESLIALGYSKTLCEVQTECSVDVNGTAASQGCAAIVVAHEPSTVTLPPGVAFDPGGVGKGLAADLVVEELIEDGAAGACVEIGGDVRVAGDAPEGDGWVVRIDDPRVGHGAIAEVWLRNGAVASSSALRRRWTAGGAWVHHLLDPSTGLPTDGSVAGASVVAGSGWIAEVLATAACVDGVGAAIVQSGACGVVVPDEGTPRLIGDFARYVE